MLIILKHTIFNGLNIGLIQVSADLKIFDQLEPVENFWWLS